MRQTAASFNTTAEPITTRNTIKDTLLPPPVAPMILSVLVEAATSRAGGSRARRADGGGSPAVLVKMLQQGSPAEVAAGRETAGSAPWWCWAGYQR